MSNENRIQTRREFFKTAVNKTLPFMAAITLPAFLHGCDEDPLKMDCDGCSTQCEGSCKESCSGSCDNTCAGNNSNSTTGEENSNSNNYEYVDLGLSVLWATHNLGATTAAEYSPKYRWGKKEDETYDEWSEWINNGAGNICGTERDIVRTMWGGGWRLPTFSEVREVAELCKGTVETRNGVKGMKIKGPNGNTIFLPIFSGTCGRYCCCGGCVRKGMSRIE